MTWWISWLLLCQSTQLGSNCALLQCGASLQDSTGGLCSCVLCMALILQRDPCEILYVSHSIMWMGSSFALLLPCAQCWMAGEISHRILMLPFIMLRMTLMSYRGVEPRPIGSWGRTSALQVLWIRQPGHLLLLTHDAKHLNFTAAVNGSCAVTSSLQELACKGLCEMRDSERTMYGLCIPAECSFLHHGKWCVSPRALARFLGSPVAKFILLPKYLLTCNPPHSLYLNLPFSTWQVSSAT